MTLQLKPICDICGEETQSARCLYTEGDGFVTPTGKIIFLTLAVRQNEKDDTTYDGHLCDSCLVKYVGKYLNTIKGTAQTVTRS